MTRGIHVRSRDRVAADVISGWEQIIDRSGEIVPESGSVQGQIELKEAGFVAARGIEHE
jgi:hypothetical protein